MNGFKKSHCGFYLPSMKPVPILTRKLSFFQKRMVMLRTRKWQIDEPDNFKLFIPFLDKTLVIPNYFLFDGASIPRPFWPFLSPTGILFIPALFHDFGYRYRCFLNEDFTLVYENENRKFFDDVFKEMSEWINNVPVAELISWGSLRLFGHFVWARYRKSINPFQVYKDFPDLGIIA